MINTVQCSPKLIAHKEGKLKSYESCFDVRAWSHDDYKRSNHLRDWIKRDHSVYVLPVFAITQCLRTMTRKHKIPFSPPCSPGCRSKVILENIDKSCHAIKECLRSEGEFEKYFENEELETSHWPCEKCVEILKSIKLFWRIILEKLLKVTMPTNEDFKLAKPKSINEFSKEWKDNIIKESLQVKNVQSLSCNRMGIFIKDKPKSNKVIFNQGERSNDHNLLCNDMFNKSSKKYKDKATNTNFLPDRGKIKHPTKSQNVCAAVEKRNISCNTSLKSLTNLSKKDLVYLKKKLDIQESKIKQLENEKRDLKLKLRNKTNDVSDLTHSIVSDSNRDLEAIKDHSKDQFETIKDIASEMLITLKSCTNKSFRNISVLQILHKSNTKSNDLQHLDDTSPIDILNRVHHTFDAMVRRELSIAKENKKYCVDKISTSYHEVDSLSVSKTSSISTTSKFESLDEHVNFL